jgi:YbbR domain-containing protein
MLSSLTENLSLKLFSLAVAVLLFLFVSIESATPIDVDFRLEYRTANDIAVVGEAPRVVHTTLRGPWASFRSFDPKDLKPVIIDLTDAGPDTVKHAIDISEIDPPGGMTVVAVRPSEIQVTLDRIIERQLPVVEDVSGGPPFGYELEHPFEFDPPRVRVTGPARDFANVDVVQTKAIHVEDVTSDFTTNVDLNPPKPTLRLKETRVAVTVHVHEEELTRSFDDLPIHLEGAPAGTHLTPDKVSVRLKGPRSLVDKLDAKSLTPYVDARQEIGEGLTQFDKAVSLRGNPERTQWTSTLPHVQVTVPRIRAKKPKRR